MSDPADTIPESSCRGEFVLPRVWAFFLLLLVAVSWPLWFSSSRPAPMPSIPLVGNGIRPPSAASVLPSLTLVAGLLLVIASPSRLRGAWWLVALSLSVSFLVDQHRLQPWAYQSAIYALVFATMDPGQARRWLIPLAASVYLYSAAGKFDFQFAHTVGQDFLETLASPLGGLPEDLNQSTRAKIALVFPTAEFLAGLGLLFRPARPFAAVFVILMHASLIAILGPWGLGHSTGVLIWNVLLIAQAYLLMLRPGWADPSKASELPRERGGVASVPVRGILLVALLAPLTERSGYWDHWPSWSLYSPHTSRVDIEIHRSAIDQLQPGLRSFLEDDTDADGWHHLAIARWSLESRRVPIYPQGRYQLALAAEIAVESQLEEEIRARLRGVSDRWTGRRREQLMLGRREMQTGLKRFWLTLP